MAGMCIPSIDLRVPEGVRWAAVAVEDDPVAVVDVGGA
jgi:hypothetical protein